MRLSPRIHGIQEIAVKYEGQRNEIAIRPPDISTRGMFINTIHKFPEGAVLHLRFRLAISGTEIETRSEVRYCLPGVGIGVEFVGLSRKSAEAIEKEVEIGTNHRHSRGSRKKKAKGRSTRR